MLVLRLLLMVLTIICLMDGHAEVSSSTTGMGNGGDGPAVKPNEPELQILDRKKKKPKKPQKKGKKPKKKTPSKTGGSCSLKCPTGYPVTSNGGSLYILRDSFTVLMTKHCANECKKKKQCTAFESTKCKKCRLLTDSKDAAISPLKQVKNYCKIATTTTASSPTTAIPTTTSTSKTTTTSSILTTSTPTTTASTSDCSCSDYINAKGFGQCKKGHKDFGDEMFCYVNLPSSCADRLPSKTDSGKWVSAEACKKTAGTTTIPTTISTSETTPVTASTSGAEGECKTTGGSPCIFPFKDGDKEYNECQDKSGRYFWCATELYESGKYKYWSYCPEDGTCPLDGKTTIPVTTTPVTASASDCSCSDYVNAKGFGQCKKGHKDFGDEMFCYVNLPSSCADRLASKTDSGKWVSAEACKKTTGEEGECKTIGGSPCIFPFKDGDKEYNECQDEGGRYFWCATELYESGKHKYWSYCPEDGTCPLDVKTTTTAQVGECKAIDEKPCVFPFKDGNKEYNECAKYGSYFWCATDTNSDGKYTSWEKCPKDGSCPLDGQTVPPVSTSTPSTDSSTTTNNDNPGADTTSSNTPTTSTGTVWEPAMTSFHISDGSKTYKCDLDFEFNPEKDIEFKDIKSTCSESTTQEDVMQYVGKHNFNFTSKEGIHFECSVGAAMARGDLCQTVLDDSLHCKRGGSKCNSRRTVNGETRDDLVLVCPDGYPEKSNAEPLYTMDKTWKYNEGNKEERAEKCAAACEADKSNCVAVESTKCGGCRLLTETEGTAQEKVTHYCLRGSCDSCSCSEEKLVQDLTVKQLRGYEGQTRAENCKKNEYTYGNHRCCLCNVNKKLQRCPEERSFCVNANKCIPECENGVQMYKDGVQLKQNGKEKTCHCGRPEGKQIHGDNTKRCPKDQYCEGGNRCKPACNDGDKLDSEAARKGCVCVPRGSYCELNYYCLGKKCIPECSDGATFQSESEAKQCICEKKPAKSCKAYESCIGNLCKPPKVCENGQKLDNGNECVCDLDNLSQDCKNSYCIGNKCKTACSPGVPIVTGTECICNPSDNPCPAKSVCTSTSKKKCIPECKPEDRITDGNRLECHCGGPPVKHCNKDQHCIGGKNCIDGKNSLFTKKLGNGDWKSISAYAEFCRNEHNTRVDNDISLTWQEKQVEKVGPLDQYAFFIEAASTTMVQAKWITQFDPSKTTGTNCVLNFAYPNRKKNKHAEEYLLPRMNIGFGGTYFLFTVNSPCAGTQDYTWPEKTCVFRTMKRANELGIATNLRVGFRQWWIPRTPPGIQCGDARKNFCERVKYYRTYSGLKKTDNLEYILFENNCNDDQFKIPTTC